MFPLAFIDNGNTLPAHVTSASEATFSMQSTASTDRMENVERISLVGSEAGENDFIFADTSIVEEPETMTIVIIFTLIFIVGVLGNGTLVIIFCRHRSMRNTPNIYMLSLALADLLVIIVCVPVIILGYTTLSWTYGKSMCQIAEFFKDVSIGVSVFTMTALSAVRYCAIVDPFRKLQTKALTVITITMIWLLSSMLATPSLIMSDLLHIEVGYNLTIIICSPYGKTYSSVDTYRKYVAVTKAFVYYLLPMSIMGVLHLMAAQSLHSSARDLPGVSQCSESGSHGRGRRYVGRVLVAYVIVFFICFFPYHLFALWFHLNPNSQEEYNGFWDTLQIIGFWTFFLNFCVNPMALYFVSDEFRAHFNQYLCCCCVKIKKCIRQHSKTTEMTDDRIGAKGNMPLHHNQQQQQQQHQHHYHHHQNNGDDQLSATVAAAPIPAKVTATQSGVILSVDKSFKFQHLDRQQRY